ncbi:hypothetical protein DMENIID0001_066200 [Sergentomyia squamirostris]
MISPKAGKSNSSPSNGMTTTSMPLELTTDTTSSNPQPSSPPGELATMTNVDVLDLHKNYVDSKIHESAMKEDNLYGRPFQIQEATMVEHQAAMLQRVVSPGDHHPDQESILIVNGESQQIIGRQIINGEHHILTRNENGDHIITRIVNTHSTHVPSPTANHHPSHHADNEPTIVYSDQLPETVLQYADSRDGIITKVPSDSIYDENRQGQIIYSHDPKNHLLPPDGKTADDEVPDPPPTSTAASLIDKPQIDLIYEDGNKTVIYTTASDQKSLELYAAATGNELGLIGETHQVVVQGGIQYSQQPGAPTLFVVQELDEGGNIVTSHQLSGRVTWYIVNANSTSSSIQHPSGVREQPVQK